MEKILRYKKYMVVLADALTIALVQTLTMNFTVVSIHVANGKQIFYYYIFPTIILTFIYLTFYFSFRIYIKMWRYARANEFFSILVLSIFSGLLYIAFHRIVFAMIPIYINLLIILLISLCTTAIRYIYYLLYMLIYNKKLSMPNQKRVLIVGAGNAGAIVINELKKDPNSLYNPICLVDDDDEKQGRYINKAKVIGKTNDIMNICNKYMIDEIFICIPSVSRDKVDVIINICMETNLKLKIYPDVTAFMNDEVSATKKLRDVKIEDLLGRNQIKLHNDSMREYLTSKIVLVTGGGGSIGSELCRQIMKYNPKQLIIFDMYENNAYDVEQELKYQYGDKLNLVVEIGSVRDVKKLEYIFEKYNPEILFHAAAHKHVPLMEHNAEEAIKNNVFGTYNTALMADRYNVKKFILISTDKAVNPTNVMGATKRFCEMILQSINFISETEFASVRFGNVLGSNGSVVPLFKRQLEAGGPLTVTDKDITRYFMTIPEAAQLVLQSAAYAKGGEIFVLDMGKPIKIVELAENLIRLSGLRPYIDIEIIFTGLRPGEKLYEELLLSEEGLTKTQNDRIFIGKQCEISYYSLDEYIYELREVIKYNDVGKIKDILKNAVNTYTPND